MPFKRLNSVQANYWHCADCQDQHSWKPACMLTIIVYNAPEHDSVEFHYTDDDGQPVVGSDFSFMASDLNLNNEQKCDVSNLIVALRGLVQ